MKPLNAMRSSQFPSKSATVGLVPPYCALSRSSSSVRYGSPSMKPSLAPVVDASNRHTCSRYPYCVLSREQMFQPPIGELSLTPHSSTVWPA